MLHEGRVAARSCAQARTARCRARLRRTSSRRRATSRRMTSSQRTGADTWRTSASMAAAASRLRLGIDVGDDRHARSLRAQGAQLRRQPLFGGLHQRAVEWRADLQRNRALGAQRLGALDRARHGRGRAGDHDLAGRVQVGRADDLAFGGLAARLLDLAASRPRIAAIAPVPTGTASCM